MYFNDSGFHNHIVHHLLTIYALGADPEQLNQAFEDNKGYQRRLLPIKERNVEKMSDPDAYKKFLNKPQYFHDFVEYFREQIEQKGWEATVNEHIFAPDAHGESLMTRMFAGMF